MHKKAAETNSRSGGGRQCVILWNELNELYGVSADTKRLPSGISTGSINRNQQPIDENEGGDTEETNQAGTPTASESTATPIPTPPYTGTPPPTPASSSSNINPTLASQSAHSVSEERAKMTEYLNKRKHDCLTKNLKWSTSRRR